LEPPLVAPPIKRQLPHLLRELIAVAGGWLLLLVMCS
jgi:hypothetical protein